MKRSKGLRRGTIIVVSVAAALALVVSVAVVGVYGPKGGGEPSGPGARAETAVPAHSDDPGSNAVTASGAYDHSGLASGVVAAKISSDPAAAAQEWLAAYLADLGAMGVESRPVRVENDEHGTHVRLAQTVGGVDVWNREANVHFSVDGTMVTAVESGFDTALTPNATTPSVSEADAAQTALATAEGGDIALARTAVLSSGTYPEVTSDRLVWMFEVLDGYERTRVAVDAVDRSVLVNRDVTVTDTVNDRRRYTYRANPLDLLWSGKGWLQYTETAKVAPWWLPPTLQVTNLHTYTGEVYDYYLNTHGRVSWDGEGARMDAVAEYSTALGANAFWNGSWTGFTTGMVTRDIVAHEWTHAVSQTSAGLDYVNASGAVNEAMSDIMGAMVDRDDWLMGDGSALGVIRSLEDPTLYDQPAHIDDVINYVPLCIDNGAVHTNSGIINHAFYLLATGLDKARAEKIAYRALERHMLPETNFTQTRLAFLAAAKDIYGAASTEYAAVDTAFAGVGITSSTVEPAFNCWYDVPEEGRWGPYPEIVASERTGIAPLTVTFDAESRIVEEQGGLIDYSWDYGDGDTGTGGVVTHTFTDPGTYIVKLTATHDTEYTEPSTAYYTLTITVFEKKSKVMAIVYDPVLATRGDKNLSTYLTWRNPLELVGQMADEMGAAAGITYEIAETHTVNEFPEFEDSFTYSETGYLDWVMGRGGSAHAGTTDYSAIMDRFDVCDKIASDNISEVWLVGGPDFGFEKWAMKIPGDAIPHTPSDPAWYPSYDLPDCGSTYSVMGWSVAPQIPSDPDLGFSNDQVLAESMDGFAQRVAGVMSLTVGQGKWYDAPASNPWHAFSLYDRDYPGQAGVGGPSNPPISTTEYDYFTSHPNVTSTADDWYDYPTTTGATQSLDCFDWGCDGVGYVRWYLAHIPRAPGSSVIGGEPFSNNWWGYVVDYDGRLDSASAVPNEPPVAKASAVPVSGTEPLEVDFDASASSDPDGSIASYRWDFDGDGTDDLTTATPTTSHTYSTAATYRPRVAVVDDDGAVASTGLPAITVQAPIPPDEVSVTIAGAISYSASGSLTSGDVNVNPPGTGVISNVTGTGTIPGPGSGTATVTFSVYRISWAGSYSGSVRVVDPTAGVNLTSSLLFTPVGRISGVPDSARASHSGTVWIGGVPKSYTISWTVRDNT